MKRYLLPTNPWWSAADRAVVMAVCATLHPVTAVEFGPGSSTLALLEGTVSHIDACEDDPNWADVADERLAGHYPERVRVVRYVWTDPLDIPELAATYDLALIDGPRTTMNRIACATLAFARCTAVLSPVEHSNRDYRPALEATARAAGRTGVFFAAGEPSGGFLLFT